MLCRRAIKSGTLLAWRHNAWSMRGADIHSRIIDLRSPTEKRPLPFTGAVLFVIKRRKLGHESLSSTEVYTHLALEDLKEAVKKAHPRGRR